MGQTPYAPAPSAQTGASRPLNQGHARANCVETSTGAKSRGEKSNGRADGRKSEPQRPNLLTSEHRQKAILIGSHTQRTQSPYDNHQSPQCCPHESSFSVFSTQDKLQSIVQIPKASSPRSTAPPVHSESSTRWTSNKAFRHATKSTVTSVDGVHERAGSNAESLLVLEPNSKNNPEGRHRKPLTEGVHFTLPQITRNETSSTAQSAHPRSTSQFLDPFQGTPIDLERQLSDISDISEYVRPNAFAGHRDTLARVRYRAMNRHELDETYVSEESDDEISVNADYAIEAFYSHEPQKILASQCFPAEILHEIFALLQPCDFEAARHACRAWYIASLDRRLTHLMMRKAGYYPAFLADLAYQKTIRNAHYLRTVGQIDEVDTDDEISEQWLASKRLATESRLSAAWHGSSLRPGSGHTTSRFSVRETIAFNNVMAGGSSDESIESDRFTVSACGRFLLIVADCDILVYKISANDSSFQPIVRLAADTKFLKVSMDTTSQHFAVAALLEGRSGACWEIGDLVFDEAIREFDHSMVQGVHTEITGSSETDNAIMSSTPLSIHGSQVEICMNIEGEGESEDWNSSATPWNTNSLSKSTSEGLSMSTQPLDYEKLSAFPTCVSPSAVFRGLGTSSDPPRSVAICPQRKCTAFGCKSGIELHWVDALTGSDLHRWFPLAAPSDHLYFLPQRVGIDSCKKLRLMSSAAIPSQQSLIASRSGSANNTHQSRTAGQRPIRKTTKLFYGNLPINPHEPSQSTQSTENQEMRRPDGCDHYRAVPLSDGSHVLFTDPKTGMLCLGSDAPLGGPTKLVRKVCMAPPASDGASPAAVCPVAYAAAHDLRWGIRIVAAYNDGRIILYNIPSDCYERLRHVSSSPDVWEEMASTVGGSDIAMDAFILDRETAMANAGYGESNAVLFKSLQLDGALICRVDSAVEALAVDASNGGLKFWIFYRDGRATQMDVYVPKNYTVRSRHAGTDGLLYDTAIPASPRASKPNSDEFCNEDPVQHNEQYDQDASHVHFFGLDGCCEDSAAVCGPFAHKGEIDLSKLPIDEGISMTPAPSDDEDEDEDDGRPLQVELLTDWRTESLLRPYVVNVAWIDAH